MWLYEQVNMRIEGCIIVSATVPCHPCPLGGHFPIPMKFPISHEKTAWGWECGCFSWELRVWGFLRFFLGLRQRLVLFLQGFDEYMNLVLDDAEEIHSKTKSRKQLGTSGEWGRLESW